MTVKVKDILPAILGLECKIIVSHMEISGGVSDHDKAPVIEGVVGTVGLHHPEPDIHELRDRAEVIPVEIGLVAHQLSYRHRPGRGIFIPGHPASGQENAKAVPGSSLNIDMIIRTVP